MRHRWVLVKDFSIFLCSWSPQEIRANITSPLARFAVSNLHPGSTYVASIYAFNAKGRSNAAVLPVAMLRLPEKQLPSEKGVDLVLQT